MQMIMDARTRLHEATGWGAQEEKLMLHSWQWHVVNGIRVIKDVEIKVKVCGKEIAQISVTQSSRTLGVYVTPSAT